MVTNLTQERLKHLLHYDPETGIWIYNNPNPRSARVSGEEAGSINGMGYRILRVDCGSYRSARLAWFYMTGEWPTMEVDHINRDRSDDRWSNLRSVDRVQNAFNRGYDLMRGMSYCGRKISVSIGGEYLGLFDRLEEAMAVRNFAVWYLGGSHALKTQGNEV